MWCNNPGLGPSLFRVGSDQSLHHRLPHLLPAAAAWPEPVPGAPPQHLPETEGPPGVGAAPDAGLDHRGPGGSGPIR